MQAERRLLQAAVALTCLVPLSVATISLVRGPEWLGGTGAIDLDSHFRYLSGIFLALGLAFASCIPRIEARGKRFRLLTLLVVTGGLGRLASLVVAGPPSMGHLTGLGIELALVPGLALWQARVARRSAPVY